MRIVRVDQSSLDSGESFYCADVEVDALVQRVSHRSRVEAILLARHPQILRPLGVVDQDCGGVHVVLPKFNGTLAQYVSTTTGPPESRDLLHTPDAAEFVVLAVSSAIAALFDAGFTPCYIAPRHIFMDSGLCPHINAFALTDCFDDVELVKELCPYLAPEFFTEHFMDSQASIVYSLCILLLTVLLDENPFLSWTRKNFFNESSEPTIVELCVNIEASGKPGLADVLRRAGKEEPAERCSLAEFVTGLHNCLDVSTRPFPALSRPIEALGDDASELQRRIHAELIAKETGLPLRLPPEDDSGIAVSECHSMLSSLSQEVASLRSTVVDLTKAVACRDAPVIHVHPTTTIGHTSEPSFKRGGGSFDPSDAKIGVEQFSSDLPFPVGEPMVAPLPWCALLPEHEFSRLSPFEAASSALPYPIVESSAPGSLPPLPMFMPPGGASSDAMVGGVPTDVAEDGPLHYSRVVFPHTLSVGALVTLNFDGPLSRGTGSVDRGEAGIITSISGEDVVVCFPHCEAWSGRLSELLVLHHQRLHVGDWVKVRDAIQTPIFQWGAIDRTCVGKIVEILDNPNVTKVVAIVNFRDAGVPRWRAHILELEPAEEPPQRDIPSWKIGDVVMVDPKVSEPRFKWGGLKRDDIGTVVRVDDAVVFVDFPSHSPWRCLASELVSSGYPDIRVGAFVRHSSGVLCVVTSTSRDACGTVLEISASPLEAEDDQAESIVGPHTDFELVPVTADLLSFTVGDRVHLRPDIREPHFGWGSVSHGDHGVVREIDLSHMPPTCVVDFPNQTGWSALVSELVRVGGGTQLNVSLGCRVRVVADEPSFGWGLVSADEIGVVTEIFHERDPVEVRVDFPSSRGWMCVASDIEPIAISADPEVGSFVKVSVPEPSFGWGAVKPTSVGVVTHLEEGILTVDFPEQPGWSGLCTDVSVTTDPFLPPILDSAGDRITVGAEVSIVALDPVHGFGPLVRDEPMLGTVSAARPGTLTVFFSNPDVSLLFLPCEVKLVSPESPAEIGSASIAVAQLPPLPMAIPAMKQDTTLPDGADVVVHEDTPPLPVLTDSQPLLSVSGEAAPVQTSVGELDPSNPESWIGHQVRIISSAPAFGFGKVGVGDIGTVSRFIVDSPLGPALSVEFPQQSGWVGLVDDLELVSASQVPEKPAEVAIPPETLESAESEAAQRLLQTMLGSGPIRAGSIVRLIPTITEPTHGIGTLRPGDIGTVAVVHPNGTDCVVAFASHNNFHARLDEIELVSQSDLEAIAATFPNGVCPGRPVRVRQGVNPEFGWGLVRQGEIGICVAACFDPDNQRNSVALVLFEKDRTWGGLLHELEYVADEKLERILEIQAGDFVQLADGTVGLVTAITSYDGSTQAHCLSFSGTFSSTEVPLSSITFLAPFILPITDSGIEA